MLRHSSITITADLYAEVVTELAREAAEKTAAMIPRNKARATPRAPTGPQASDPSNGRRSHELFSLVRRGAPGRASRRWETLLNCRYLAGWWSNRSSRCRRRLGVSMRFGRLRSGARRHRRPITAPRLASGDGTWRSSNPVDDDFSVVVLAGIAAVLAGRDASWKDVEILLLRHQLGVIQWQQVRKPGLTLGRSGPDRRLLGRPTHVRGQGPRRRETGAVPYAPSTGSSTLPARRRQSLAALEVYYWTSCRVSRTNMGTAVRARANTFSRATACGLESTSM
jgi:hypothetical protein